MNYVERHFGDWARDTAHLSMLEDGAYNRLCDLYYVREGALPAELAACCRLARAASKQERDAVESVLREFFTLCDEGWRHKRCDAEIERYQLGEPEREVKKANEDNRMRRHREERARLFKVITDAGQHAAWNIPMTDLRELVQRLTATQPETGAVTPPATAPATPATATQTPLPTTHSPNTNPSEPEVPQGKARKRAQPPEAPAGVSAQTWADWLALRKAKRAPVTQTVLDGAAAEAAKAGMTLEVFLQVWCSRGSQGLQADWLKPNERPPPLNGAHRSATDRQIATMNALTGKDRHGPADPTDTIDVAARVVS